MIADDALDLFRAGTLEGRVDVIDHVNAVGERETLGLAVGVREGEFCDGRAVAAVGMPPAGDVAEDVKAAGLEVRDGHLDFLGIVARDPAAALEHDEVVASRASGWLHDVERNVAGLHDSKFLEVQTLGRLAAIRIDALGAVGGEGLAQVDDAIFALLGSQITDDVAKPLRAERLKAFRHQRAAGRSARGDVLFLNFDVAGGVAQFHGGP